MEYFKSGEQMRMMYYSVMTQPYSEKEIPSSPNRSRTYDLPITSSDALPLSYRRLVGAKAIKLGSCILTGFEIPLFFVVVEFKTRKGRVKLLKERRVDLHVEGLGRVKSSVGFCRGY